MLQTNRQTPNKTPTHINFCVWKNQLKMRKHYELQTLQKLFYL